MKMQVESYRGRESFAYSDIIRATIKHLRGYRGENITFKQVDKSYLLGFIDYLNKIKSGCGKPLSDASKALYYDVISIALNKAVKEEIISFNPASKISCEDRPRQREATKQYLTFDEVKLLINTPCKDENVKRAFLFACFVG